MGEPIAEVEAYPDTEGCEGCPLIQWGGGDAICTASPDDTLLGYREIDEVATMGGPAPDWCPLRRGGVLVVARG